MKKKIVLIAALAALCLAGCGSNSSSSAADSSAAAPAAQSQAEPAPAESQAESTAEPAADSAAESQAEAPAASSFTAADAKVKYNGFDFGVGDNINDIKGSLGAEAAPASQAPSCLSGNMINEYYFAGMTLQANNDGVIFSIELTNALYQGGDAATAGGFKLGDTVDSVKAKYGEPTETKGTSPVYTDGTVSMQLIGASAGLESIWITDTSIEN